MTGDFSSGPSNVIHIGGGGGSSAAQRASAKIRGSGGGGGDGMEERVGKLEVSLTALRLDVAEIKGRLQAMPTTWQMIGIIFASMALVSALFFGMVKLPH